MPIKALRGLTAGGATLAVIKKLPLEWTQRLLAKAGVELDEGEMEQVSRVAGSERVEQLEHAAAEPRARASPRRSRSAEASRRRRAEAEVAWRDEPTALQAEKSERARQARMAKQAGQGPGGGDGCGGIADSGGDTGQSTIRRWRRRQRSVIRNVGAV